MKAVQLKQYGGNEALDLVDVSKPILKDGQILVEVYAASINPFDLAVRAGFIAKMIPQLPITIGGDFSGVVLAVAPQVTDVIVGDKVYGSAMVLTGGSGAFAEMASANLANSATKPKTINFQEAAALPLVGSSVLQALLEHIKLQRGQKILIHGGAGGIGHIAIQVAKELGAFVATTVSTDDVAFAQSLGANEVIDYKKQDFTKIVKDVDGVFSTVAGEVIDKSFPVLKRGGVLVSMLGQPSEELGKRYGITVIGQQTRTTTEHLNRLTQLVDSKKVKVNIEKVFAISDVRQAFEYQQTGHPRGKVVLKIKDEH